MRLLRRIVVLPALLVCGAFAQAGAQATITGTVKSDEGQALSSANVFITELNVSVATNANGQYVISLAPARLHGATSFVLRARAIGFAPTSRSVSATTQTIDFKLRQDINRLSEVVVTGVTGATVKTKVPFAIQNVDAADLLGHRRAIRSQALQGKVPGANIVIRVGTSRRAAGGACCALRPRSRPPAAVCAPLYVVDGIILGDQLTNTGGGGLAGINPQDIESVEVIEGAAAARSTERAPVTASSRSRRSRARAARKGLQLSGRSECGTSDIERSFAIAQTHGLRLDPTGTRFCITTSSHGYARADMCARTIDYAQEAYT